MTPSRTYEHDVFISYDSEDRPGRSNWDTT
jgi:hypothetical protein